MEQRIFYERYKINSLEIGVEYSIHCKRLIWSLYAEWFKGWRNERIGKRKINLK